MPFQLPADLPFPEEMQVGVAFNVNPSNGQPHIGFLYRSSKEQIRFLHLAFNFTLLDEEPQNYYHWDKIELDTLNAFFLAGKLEVCSKDQDKIPYGFHVDGNCFDDKGRYVEQPIGKGLTCSTFVTAFLQHFGFRIIEEDSWPERPEDAAWQRHIIDLLVEHGASQEQIEALSGDIGSIRVKPQETAAALTWNTTDEWPLRFESIDEKAKEIFDLVDTRTN